MFKDARDLVLHRFAMSVIQEHTDSGDLELGGTLESFELEELLPALEPAVIVPVVLSASQSKPLMVISDSLSQRTQNTFEPIVELELSLVVGKFINFATKIEKWSLFVVIIWLLRTGCRSLAGFTFGCLSGCRLCLKRYRRSRVFCDSLVGSLSISFSKV